LFTFLLIVHGLLAVALIGAITHQAVAACWPAPKTAGSFTGRYRAVAAPSYANAIALLYLATFLLGGIIYTEYRVVARPVVEQLEAWPAFGAFELKEHFAALGMGMLPAYWMLWRRPAEGRTRAIVTALLAFIVWWNFLTGHILNNLRGLGS
jgi:hypothetical protein